MKIIFSGGGTLGPVIPLVAIAEMYRKHNPKVEYLWVGTETGPEREIIHKHGIPFVTISSGKLRRYFSWLNVFDVFRIGIAFFQSLVLLIQERPDMLVSCGGFVSVPLHWAGALLGIPSWVHQQDVRLGLANRLMFPFAAKITTALRETAEIVPKKKTEWIGNPSRDLSVSNPLYSRIRFNIPDQAPVIFAMGGGTGSASINKLILDTLPHLPKDWHVIHVVGKERSKEAAERAAHLFPNYHMYQFLTEEMKDAYAAADVVVARAGFSTLTELASLSKAAVIMPMFGTHQEDNTEQFAAHRGIIALKQGDDTGVKLAQILRDIIEVPEKRHELGSTLHTLLPRPTAEKIVGVIDEVAHQK